MPSEVAPLDLQPQLGRDRLGGLSREVSEQSRRAREDPDSAKIGDVDAEFEGQRADQAVDVQLDTPPVRCAVCASIARTN